MSPPPPPPLPRARARPQVVDRPKQGHKFLSRDYVQPQWVFDSANFRVLMPPELYAPGLVPPPHLSPFVSEADGDDGYMPDFAKTIKRLQVGGSVGGCGGRLRRAAQGGAAPVGRGPLVAAPVSPGAALACAPHTHLVGRLWPGVAAATLEARGL